MVDRARQAVAEAGLPDGNIELRVAEIEKTELSDGVADVVISNCVINLCPDKDAVYGEAFRILRPGGRLAISDIALTEHVGPELRERFRSAWAGCLGGAVPEEDYMNTVRAAGFVDVRTVARHLLAPDELEAMACCPGKEFTPAPAKEDLAAVEGKVMSIKFTAIKG
jgi:SAM-dependent methyltransferase